METSVAVAFNLVDDFLEAKARHFGFMLRGLRVVEYNLKALEIPFFLFQGTAEENIPNFLERCGASLLVMDFSPLLIGRIWRENICNKVGEGTAIHEVDAHNIVPVWRASDKLEYSARTIRTKIQKQLPEYLVQFPDFKTPDQKWIFEKPAVIDWDSLIDSVLRKGAEVPEIRWCEPGEDAAKEVLLGKKNGFLTTKLKNYADDRNDPSKPTGLSGLSPYLHYGQISSQRCALEARAFRKIHPKYQIDGRDPNGYVGCMWSICGVHDQGWQERPVFGKIRYMNYAGCKRKFNVDGYIMYVNQLVAQTKKKPNIGSLIAFTN